MSLEFTTSLFTDNNFGGSGRLVGLPHDTRYRVIRQSQMIGFGLLSSAEVSARPRTNAHAILFDSVTNIPGLSFGIPLGNFNGRFLQLTNLRDAASELEVPRFGDFVFNDTADSLLLVASGRGREGRVSFRDMFLSEWRSTIDAELSDGARRDGDPVLTWEMFPQGISHLNSARRYLKIFQRLDIELDWWPDYEAWIKYHIHLSVSGGQLVGAVHRWEYWVEGGIKSGAIGDRIETAVVSGMNTLNRKLAERLPLAALLGRPRDVYFLPGRQLGGAAAGTLTGSTTDDVTIVVEFE